MDDLFSDGKFEDTCDKEDRHSFLSSLAMLIILCALVIVAILPNLPKQPEPEPAYQMDATILNIERRESGYYATVEGFHGLVEEYHEVVLNRQEFMKYKEDQSVRVEVKGDSCRILN